ncbi:uncharacterized protein LOC143828370 [Paroedura picta]|uniref:uncharacterized protein LOC143828370 n=1 Tax=Paroedura picta TaxID=143630 RepID=UPI00405721EB
MYSYVKFTGVWSNMGLRATLPSPCPGRPVATARQKCTRIPVKIENAQQACNAHKRQRRASNTPAQVAAENRSRREQHQRARRHTTLPSSRITPACPETPAVKPLQKRTRTPTEIEFARQARAAYKRRHRASLTPAQITAENRRRSERRRRARAAAVAAAAAAAAAAACHLPSTPGATPGTSTDVHPTTATQTPALTAPSDPATHPAALQPLLVPTLRGVLPDAFTIPGSRPTSDPHSCGNLTETCLCCKARHFPSERHDAGRYTTCCSKGAVSLPPIGTATLINDLLSQHHEYSSNFLANICSINSSLAFASMDASVAPPPHYGPNCFRIHGAINYHTGTLHPATGEPHKYAQLYILDSLEATRQRLQQPGNEACNPLLLQELCSFMEANNPFAQACKMLYKVEQDCLREALANNAPPPTVTMAIIQDREYDPQQYKALWSNEVAVIFESEDSSAPLLRDLLIHCRSPTGHRAHTNRISILDPNLEPLVYPLLFPLGDQSWGTEIRLNRQPASTPRVRPQAAHPRTRITQRQYYQFRLSVRDTFNPFLAAGRLTQQYIVDAYVKTEANRLNFLRNNQTSLTVESSHGFMDHLQQTAGNVPMPDTAFVLPSSFQGSPRNIMQNYQDAMAIVREYGKPDLFITMTCNPQWPEIQENLDGQQAENRPDIVARVFHLKLTSLLDDLMRRNIFGIPVAQVHVVMFQKRGLPCAHLLLLLKQEFKPHTPDIIDLMVCAEIPDPHKMPTLYDAVTEHMIHGPCGDQHLYSPCMKDKKCSERFPKSFQEDTLPNHNGYPLYRRRDNSRTAYIRGVRLDNRWVVPYNPYLLLRYNCHINVEVCASVKSVKYIFKYIYKGYDRAPVRVMETHQKYDEIQSHVDSRYISPPEAMWRLLSYSLHSQSHVILRLPVHLPGFHSAIFDEHALQDNVDAVARPAQRETMLTAWFRLNEHHKEARSILYTDIPHIYIFHKETREWVPRKHHATNLIGRMYSVNYATDTELSCLRLLLLHVPGATSFEHLRTFNDIPCATFKEAALHRGLLHDDNVWDATMAEAALCGMPHPLRDLFAYILIFGVVPRPQELFDNYKDQLWEDYAIQHMQGHTDECIKCLARTLQDIDDTLQLHGSSCAKQGLQIPLAILPPPEDEHNPQHYHRLAKQMADTLNDQQLAAYNAILEASQDETRPHRCYFIDGPGGTGKTYLYSTLIYKFKGQGSIVLPVASTGIAANLLVGGRTFFSQFKLLPPLTETSVSNITPNSPEATTICRATAIIWDEATMAPRAALTVVDRLLKGLMSSDKPFGGKLLILGGDFRQTLPIVSHSDRTTTVEATIKHHPLWPFFKIFPLTVNVRATDHAFSQWVLRVGDGAQDITPTLPEDFIEIPRHTITTCGLPTDIFGTQIMPADTNTFINKAILCPRISHVDTLNATILHSLEGTPTTYYSIDSIEDKNDENSEVFFPIEFLHSLKPPGMPPHHLTLKIGAIVMLLRNLNTKKGLCNGTRLIVTDLRPNVILARIITGSALGETLFIPRINLAPKDPDLPFTLRRQQFPLRLAFAMTINKSQGQTLSKVGLHLEEPVFNHGQLYVALSRVSRFQDLRVHVTPGPQQGMLLPLSDRIFTRNIVYQEVL